MKEGATCEHARLNRRAFLRGAAGVSVALPFLESLPERSAWAADETPVFGLFICAMGGVVPSSFFPDRSGRLTPEGLVAAGKATSELAAHASRLLFLSGIDYPESAGGDAHVDGLCSAITGRASQRGMAGVGCGSAGNCAMASGPSADVVIASRVHPGELPLVLALGNARNGYAADRLSFIEAGKLAPASYKPYQLYEQLMGLVPPGSGTTTARQQAARLLVESRATVHDLVGEDLANLKSHPRLSSADRQRLEQHLQSIRDAELAMADLAKGAMESCTSQGLNVSALEALQDFTFDPRRTEEIGQLYLSLVALAFACNYRRTASLQWVPNGQLHNTLITAAIRHTGETMENFGEGSPGQVKAILA